MQHESKLNESPLTTTGHLRVAQENAKSCWNLLVKHCQSNYCNCHLDVGGSVHLVQGCVTGLMLWDEYSLATARVRALTPVPPCPTDVSGMSAAADATGPHRYVPPLEPGDMESTIEDGECSCGACAKCCSRDSDEPQFDDVAGGYDSGGEDTPIMLRRQAD